MTAMRPETTSEHIARDMREGRFPERSEPQMVADQTNTAPERIWVAGTPQECGSYFENRVEAEGEFGGIGVEYVRADLAAVPAQVLVKPLDLSNALKHAFISGRVSAGAASSFHADAWAEYDPAESAGYTRILAALEPQPDPRDDVIARLVEVLRDCDGGLGALGVPRDAEPRSTARATLAAAKAVQHD